MRPIRPHLLLLVLAAIVPLACGDTDTEAEPQPRDTTPPAPEQRPGEIVVTGEFRTPESVLHDSSGDVYLVSSIEGAPLDKDGNGFISRVSPQGTLEQLKWIEGGVGAVRLSAPKGMAILGDSLFVSDIDTIRIFHRQTGEPLGDWGVEGATFLNDVAAGGGFVYVTDTGMRAGEDGFEPSGTDAVYRFDRDGAMTRIASGDALRAPNGIVVDGSRVVVATFGGDQLLRIEDNVPTSIASLPAGQLDGLVRLGDGSFLVSSWAGGAVYRIRPGGDAQAVVEGVEAPADIGWDAQRSRVLVPLFNDDRILIREVAAEASASAVQSAAADTGR